MTMFNFLGGLGLGAGAAYFLDPDLGRRRRSLLRDQFFSLRHRAEDAYDKASRDLYNRAEGTLAELRSTFSSDNAPDRVLQERIRAKLGRFVSHPHAVQVIVQDGYVTLQGPMLASEVERFINVVCAVPGVRHVHSQLDVHQHPDISALQGGKPRVGERLDWMQETWAPGTGLLVGGAGTALMLNCFLRRSPGSILLGTAGFFMAVQAARKSQQGSTNGSRPMTRVRGQTIVSRRRTEQLKSQEAAGMPPGAREVRM